MKHIVWGVLVLVYLGSIVLFPTAMTFITLFLGAYKVSEMSSYVGKWVETKYKEKQS
jgi:uncharacterized metal-binding protein